MAVVTIAASASAAEQPVDRDLLLALRAPNAEGVPIVVEGIPLDPGGRVAIQVERFEVFTPDAVVIEEGAEGVRTLRPRSDAYYRGTVIGDPDSQVVIAVGARMRGFIATRGEVFALASEADAYRDRDPEQATFVRRIDPVLDRPARNQTWRCDGELLPPRPEELSSLLSGVRTTQALFSSVVYRATLAIDTDHELYTILGSTSALTTYIGDLVAAASAIYFRDVKTVLQVGTLYTYSTAADPWSATTTSDALYEVGAYWHSNHLGVSRDTVVFLSGKDMGGGIAWIEVLCDPDFYYGGHWGGGYAVIASLNGAFSTTNPNLYWDIFGFSHELGHNFASPHTHCYSPPVDTCYSGETGCYTGKTSVPAEKGTIMSYCHLLSGGYSNLKLFLGVAGEPSEAVTDLVRTYVESKSGCLDVVGDPPTVTDVDPDVGVTTGGTNVTITGTRFVDGAAVTFGGASATGVVVVNDTTITATTPAHAVGLVDVVVTNPDDLSGTLASSFSYGPRMSISRSALYFGGTSSGATTTSGQSVTVRFDGPGTPSWTASSSKTWILVSPTSGSGNGSVTISIKAGRSSSGSGTITISSSSATGSPKTVAVNYTYYASATAPFGVFDTPVDGTTGVVGQVAVTGWALDDIEVTGVSIYRDPMSGEGVGSNGKVYIGDAVFIPGARPDVEGAYPTYPLAYRAGWGYALLTNMLPSGGVVGTTGGNGVFTLYAYATDKDAHTVLLGSKTITCDNAGATKPFGSIDVPGQGATVSGTILNWGWALTPGTATIPTDGSTIWVYVDTTALGHPVYNLYRSDIATLFPGYTNSGGAVGYFTLDTTTLSNGLHSIAWSVTDDQGHTEGIGSRFFWVAN